MGKASYSPLGQWRNKVGGQVYRIDSGEQIVSAYQPVVKNPRTTYQQTQRNKFTSASKFLAATRAFIYTINPTGSRRMLRANVLKKIIGTMQNAGVSITAINGILNLNPSQLLETNLNVINSTAANIVVTGTVVLGEYDNGDQASIDDFVDGAIDVYIHRHYLDENGNYLESNMDRVGLTAGTMEYTATYTWPTGATGVVVETSAIGVLTAEAFTRYSRFNAMNPISNDMVGALPIYSEASATIYSANSGRGALIGA